MSTINNDTEALSENFVISTFQISSKMEDEAHRYVKSAGERDKEIEKDWVGINEKKRREQLNLSQQSKYLAYVYTTLMVVSVATTVGSTVVSASAAGNPSNLANFLSNLSGMVSNQGTTIAREVGGVHSQKTQAEITGYTDAAEKLRYMTKQDQEARKQDLNSLKEKTSSGAREGIDKTGNTYSSIFRG